MSTTISRSLIPTLIGLLAIGSPLFSTAGEVPPSYETGEELLSAINNKMKEMNRSTFTLDELTVWLARQAGQTRSDGQLLPRVANFLEHLATKKRFEYPVGLQSFWSSDLPLTDDIYSKKRLRLPDHYVLEVAIFNVPWGSKDAEGNRLKVTWSSIMVATALTALHRDK